MPDWDIEDGNEGTDGDGDNKSFKDLRNYSKKLEREQKAALTELEELRAFRAQVVEEKRDATLGTVFKEVGLNESQAKLYKALNPEVEPDAITPESVFNFAKEYGLVAAEAETPAAAEPEKAGFTPVQVGRPSPLKTYTQDEIRDLMSSGNLEEVNRAYAEGRVEKTSAPWAR